MRPDDINVALLFHVLGAMLLVGGLLTAASAAIIGWRDEGLAMRRFSYKTLLWVAFPGYLVMRGGAQWVEAKEHLDELPDEPAWISIGYITADGGGLLLLIALILGGIGLRRAGRDGGGSGMLKTTGVIATLLVAVYVVAVWAMGGKPS